MTVHLLALALALSGLGAPDPARLDRARANYEALAARRLHWNQLPAQELADLRAFAEALRRQVRDTRTPAQRCFDREFASYGRTLTDLQQRLIDLHCRPIGEGLD